MYIKLVQLQRTPPRKSRRSLCRDKSAAAYPFQIITKANSISPQNSLPPSKEQFNQNESPRQLKNNQQPVNNPSAQSPKQLASAAEVEDPLEKFPRTSLAKEARKQTIPKAQRPIRREKSSPVVQLARGGRGKEPLRLRG